MPLPSPKLRMNTIRASKQARMQARIDKQTIKQVVDMVGNLWEEGSMSSDVLGNAVAIHTLLGDGSHGRRLHVCGEGSLLYQPLRTQNDGPKLQDLELLAFLVRDRGLHVQEHNLHSSHDSLWRRRSSLWCGCCPLGVSLWRSSSRFSQPEKQ